MVRRNKTHFLTPFLLIPALVALFALYAFCSPARAATDVKIEFTLKTADLAGKPLMQNRSYFIYRPDNLPKDNAAPLVICMSNRPALFLHRKADEAGFVLVSGVILGHTNPSHDGFEDIDYTTAVIDQVKAAENCNDVFICGLSMGGHMACAYACERPANIRAAADADEFMSLTANRPSAPVPMLFLHGTHDSAVPYAMVKDTVDAWLITNHLTGVKPVTTCESAPLAPGQVTQTTWEGTHPVAFVTIIGGQHEWAIPTVHTGYDSTDAMWSFFARFLTPDTKAPKITAPPLKNVQQVGCPASFRVAAVGEGPLQYQWQKNAVDIPGATALTYTTPNGADNAAAFRVVVTNRFGTATSADAVLTLLPASPGPVIAKAPRDQSAIAGKPVTFTVDTTTPAAHFQWQKNGMDIPAATAASYTIAAAIPADNGATFRVLLTDAAGTTVSPPATLAVTAAPGVPVIVTNPARARTHPGDSATFSVTATSSTPLTYQWQQATWTTNYVDIPGATAATYTTPPVFLSNHHTLYRCILTNPAGTTSSAAEMLFVTAPTTPPAPAK